MSTDAKRRKTAGVPILRERDSEGETGPVIPATGKPVPVETTEVDEPQSALEIKNTGNELFLFGALALIVGVMLFSKKKKKAAPRRKVSAGYKKRRK